MPDALSNRQWSQFNGAVRAKIFSSKRESVKPSDNPNIPDYQRKALRWNIGWYVTDEDSLYNGERLWESFYWYPELSDDDIDAMKVSEQAKLRRYAVAREQRLISLGITNPDDDDSVDWASFVSREYELSVNTNARGRTFIQGVYALKEDSGESTTTEFDV